MVLNLGQCYQIVGHALNDLQQFSAAAGTPNSVSISELANSDPDAGPHLHDGTWVYNYHTTYQSRVQPGGYGASTGQLSIVPVWTPPTSGDPIILTHYFPVRGQVLVTDTDYYWICNEAARWLWFEHELMLASIAGQRSYSLATYGRWLTQRDQLLSDAQGGPLLDPPVVPGYPPRDGAWRRPRLDFIGGSPTLWLSTPYDLSGLAFSVRVRCPVVEFINGADRDGGLVTDADIIQTTHAEFETVGLWIAYRTLSMGVGPEAAAFGAMAKDQEARARRLVHFFAREAPAPAVPSQVAAAQPAAAISALQQLQAAS